MRKGQVVLISKAEHPAVYESAHRLEQRGIIVKDIPLENDGRVSFEEFKKLMTSDVALVSIIHVSNETGFINDIKKLCEYAKSVNSKVIFHSDGVQAFGKIKVNLMSLGVDLYTISGHKVYSPRGIAGLWIKNNINKTSNFSTVSYILHPVNNSESCCILQTSKKKIPQPKI